MNVDHLRAVRVRGQPKLFFLGHYYNPSYKLIWIVPCQFAILIHSCDLSRDFLIHDVQQYPHYQAFFFNVIPAAMYNCGVPVQSPFPAIKSVKTLIF